MQADGSEPLTITGQRGNAVLIGEDDGRVAPITSTVKGLSSEVPVGRATGLGHDSAVSLDNVLTVPADVLGRTLGFLTPEQERHLARAIVLAYDLEVRLLEEP